MIFLNFFKLSNSFGKLSGSGSLYSKKIVDAEEKYETGTGNMARIWLPAVNIPTLKRLKKQDPAKDRKFLMFH